MENIQLTIVYHSKNKYWFLHLTLFSSTIAYFVNGNSCLISQIISFIPAPNEYGCVYA